LAHGTEDQPDWKIDAGKSLTAQKLLPMKRILGGVDQDLVSERKDSSIGGQRRRKSQSDNRLESSPADLTVRRSKRLKAKV
jgi:hypothetical protein